MRRLSALVLIGCCFGAGFADSLEQRVDTAWRRMMAERWSPKTGLVYTTKPDAVKPVREFADGLFRWTKESKDGYGRGMADCSIVSGIGLVGICDAYAVTTNEALRAEAKRVAKGLFANATAHRFKGFVARGVCAEDGRSICSLSSIDQHTHWFHGLWRYAKSPLADADDRRLVARLFVDVMERIVRMATPSNGYDLCQADGRPDPRGICHVWHDLPPGQWKSVHGATRLPMFCLATWDLTGDAKWKRLYDRYVDTALKVNVRLRDENPDPLKWAMPTYSLLQMACANEVLLALESDPKRQAMLRDCLQAGARIADARTKDKLARPGKKWYGMCPDAELALAMLYAPDFDFDAAERGVLADRLNGLTPWNSLAVTHYYAAYWRARRRGIDLELRDGQPVRLGSAVFRGIRPDRWEGLSIYRDLMYGPRGDAPGEGPGYRCQITGRTPDGRWYHTHRTGQFCDVIVPTKGYAANAPVYVHFHGGAWCQAADKDGESMQYLKRYVDAGFVVVNADYIMPPDILDGSRPLARTNTVTFLSILRDIDTLASWLKRDLLPSIGVAPTKFTIGGGSAGGHLSALYGYDQANPSHIGAGLRHEYPVGLVVNVVGPTDLASEDFSKPFLKGEIGVLTMFNAWAVDRLVTLLGWLTGDDIRGRIACSDLDGVRHALSRFSPNRMVTKDTPPTILAYCRLMPWSDTDGCIPTSTYYDLMSRLETAGVPHWGDLRSWRLHGWLREGYEQWVVDRVRNVVRTW